MSLEIEHAIVVWVHRTLLGRLSRPCSSLADLCDGVLLAQILHEIAPTFFDATSGAGADAEAASNWALRLSTLKRVVRGLGEYYAKHLGKDVRHIEGINLTAIARDNDAEEMLSLLELVVGAAVMCDDKARFIQDIFALDAASQLALKCLIEQCMARVQPLEQGQEQLEGSSSITADAQVMIGELQQVVGHLHQERQRLLEEASANAQATAALQRDNEALSLRVAELERDQEASEGSDRHRTSVAAGVTESLRRELDECKRELDVRMVEADNLRAGARTFEQRLAASKELQARLEMENAQVGDELDVLRDKAARLGRAEQAAEKYAKKLEDLPALRKENKDLLARLDQYLDKIQELEAGSRAGATLQRLVDQYKDKAVEMERDKFEALSARQMQQHELTRLQQEAEDAQEARRFLEDELAAVRAELEQYQGDGGAGKARSSTSSFHGEGDLFDTETMASLREKLRIAERELRSLRSVGSGSGNSSSGNSAEVAGEPSPTAAQLSYEELLQRDTGVAVQELALCRAELEDALRAKREREEALISLRKQLSEAQLEMQRAHKLLAEGDSGRGGGTAATEGGKGDKGGDKALKESEAKLAQAQNTLRLLEERLREKETSLSSLEQQKDALEVFSRSSLQSFRDKFTHSLEQWKEERAMLQAKLASAQQRTDKQQATAVAEQRLVLSAVYELGAKIMDRNLQGLPLGGGGAMMDGRKRGVQTFLGAQTAGQLRVLDSQLLTGVAAGGGSLTGTPSTPFR